MHRQFVMLLTTFHSLSLFGSMNVGVDAFSVRRKELDDIGVVFCGFGMVGVLLHWICVERLALAPHLLRAAAGFFAFDAMNRIGVKIKYKLGKI